MTRAQQGNWKNYCSEPLEQIENFKAAKADNFAGWCIHHRLEIQQDKRVSRQELKDKDLYYDRPASELIFMRFGEHSALHYKGENNPLFGKHHSEETLQKMSVNNGRFWKGKHLSEDHRQKMSVNNGRFWKGRTFSEEHCKKIAESLRGKHLSSEHRKKLSESLRGENHPFFGKHHSTEARKKMSKTRKGMLWWNNGVSCKCSRECPGEGWTRGRLICK